MNSRAERQAPSSPTSSTDRIRSLNESKRRRDSFSFDPMAISPIFRNLEFFVDIDHADPEFAVEVKKMIEKMEGKVTKKIKPDCNMLVIWRRGSYTTMTKADEANIPIVNQRWVFACAQGNEKLPIEDYLITRSEREEAKLRMELGIKKECRNKRSSANSKYKANPTRDTLQKEVRDNRRMSMRLENASKKGDIDGVLASMADTLKEICEDDPELNKILGADINDHFTDPNNRVISESTEDERSLGKQTKRFENELSLKKPVVIIEAKAFVRCLQNNGFRLMLFQGDFSYLKDLMNYRTEDNCGLNIIKAEHFHRYANDINYFMVVPNSEPTLGLLYSILKNCRIVDQAFLDASRKAKLMVSLSRRPDLICNKKYTPANTSVLQKTSVMVYSPPDISKEVETRIWALKTGIERYGGRITETAGLADLVVVMQVDAEKFINRKENTKLKALYLSIVNENWVIDSIFSGIRKKFDANEYQIKKESQPAPKKAPSQTGNIRQFLRASHN